MDKEIIMIQIQRYAWKVWVTLGLLVNVVIGGNMYESMCSRAYARQYRKGIIGFYSRFVLRLMGEKHCAESRNAYLTIAKALSKERHRARLYKTL